MSDINRTIWSRDHKIKGRITHESERYCAACGRHSCYIVKWDDNTITKPCTKGVSCLPNGDLIIS